MNQVLKRSYLICECFSYFAARKWHILNDFFMVLVIITSASLVINEYFYFFGFFRIHSQALTLAALAGAAAVEYYEHHTGAKAKKYERHFEYAEEES
jgi:hypothetical protein